MKALFSKLVILGAVLAGCASPQKGPAVESKQGPEPRHPAGVGDVGSVNDSREVFDLVMKDSKGGATCFNGQIKKFAAQLSEQGAGRPVDLDTRDFTLLEIASVTPRNNGYSCQQRGEFTYCDFTTESTKLLVVKASMVNAGEFMDDSVVFRIDEKTRYQIRGGKDFMYPSEETPLDEKKSTARVCKVMKPEESRTRRTGRGSR